MSVELKMVNVGHIHLDERYQRKLDTRRLKQMAKAFDQGASKAVSLSLRADGTMWIYDGNHTLALYKDAGRKYIPAVIIRGTAEEEARWFLLMNGSGPVKANPSQKQQAAYFSGERIAIEAQAILDDFGILIAGGGTQPGQTRSIDFIKTCLKSDKPRLLLAMGMIDRLWRDEREAWTRTIMRGAWEIAGVDLIERVEAGLKKNKVTPRRVLDVAQGMQLATGEPGGGMGFVKKAMLALSQVSI